MVVVGFGDLADIESEKCNTQRQGLEAKFPEMFDEKLQMLICNTLCIHNKVCIFMYFAYFDFIL